MLTLPSPALQCPVRSSEFSTTECVVPIIQNIVDACQKLVKISLKHELPLASKTMNESEVIRSTRVNSAEDDFSALKDAVKIIWADPQIKKAFSLSLGESSSKDAVNANDDFFLSKADKVLTPGYVPTDEDILKLRRSTSGAHSLDFKFDPKKFGKGHDKGISGQKHKSSYWTLTDVGGQIHERATWYEEFADLDGLVFVLSLPDFDQKSQDNRSANKLVEDGINLMLQVMRADNLLEVPVCVLLNKFDIFVKKIAASDEGISAVFPEYKGNPKNAGERRSVVQSSPRQVKPWLNPYPFNFNFEPYFFTQTNLTHPTHARRQCRRRGVRIVHRKFHPRRNLQGLKGDEKFLHHPGD